MTIKYEIIKQVQKYHAISKLQSQNLTNCGEIDNTRSTQIHMTVSFLGFGPGFSINIGEQN